MDSKRKIKGKRERESFSDCAAKSVIGDKTIINCTSENVQDVLDNLHYVDGVVINIDTWIPIESGRKMPEKYEEVLLQCRMGVRCIAILDSEGFWVDEEDCVITGALAWIPLPKPCRGEG